MVTLQHLRRRLRRPSDETLVDLSYIGGLVLIVFGCAWVYGPAGPLAAGILLVQTAWRAGRDDVEALPPRQVVERWYSKDDDVDEDES